MQAPLQNRKTKQSVLYNILLNCITIQSFVLIIMKYFPLSVFFLKLNFQIITEPIPKV